MALEFGKLKENYSIGDKTELFTNVLGGGFQNLVNNPNYDNTCAIRISAMLNAIGVEYKIPPIWGQNDGGHTDQNGNHILIKVRSAHDYLMSKFGEPYWGYSKQPGSAFDYSTVPSKTGILLYHANFSNARGHVDLWNGSACLYNCPETDLGAAFQFTFWKVDP